MSAIRSGSPVDSGLVSGAWPVLAISTFLSAGRRLGESPAEAVSTLPQPAVGNGQDHHLEDDCGQP
jgi:hypothetical protein